MALNKQKEENKKRKEEEAERVRVSRPDVTIVSYFKIGILRWNKLYSIGKGKEIFHKNTGLLANIERYDLSM